MEIILKAYYQLVEDSQGLPEWQRKFEDEIGQAIHYMTLTMDESVHDFLVEKSEYFKRFVSILELTLAGQREAEVLQVRTASYCSYLKRRVQYLSYINTAASTLIKLV